MTILEYLKLPEMDLSASAQEAFDLFRSRHPEVAATFEYFRTKFNKAKREAGIVPQQTPRVKTSESNEPSAKDLVEEDLTKGVFKVEKYNEGNTEIVIPDPIPTGTFFDKVISDNVKKIGEAEEPFGGFHRKCVDVTAGRPGAGKTYSRAALAVEAKLNTDTIIEIINKKKEELLEAGKKKEASELDPPKKLRIRLLSGEMRKSEWDKELANNPCLKELDVVYMINYIGKSNYWELMEEALSDCDIAIVDSFPVILHHLMLIAKRGVTEKKMVFDLINFFIETSEKNDMNIQLINQVLKDGNYKGGTELPHMTSSMSFVEIDGNKRFMWCYKNRNNGNTVNRRLYFTKDKEKGGRIKLDEDSYKATYEVPDDSKQSLKDLLENIHNRTVEKMSELDERIEEGRNPGGARRRHQYNIEEQILELEGQVVPTENPAGQESSSSQGE
jgi:hypothetical protein